MSLDHCALASPPTPWVAEVLHFWFVDVSRQQWFGSGAAFDEQVRAQFLHLHGRVAALPDDALLVDAKTAIAAIIVLDQFSRNMFRGTPNAFGSDNKALRLAQIAIARGFAEVINSDERLFLYLPFEHHEDADAQAQSVALIASLGDPELTKYAIAHKHIIDRFGRFPHRNAILGRTSTGEELEFLSGPNSAF